MRIPSSKLYSIFLIPLKNENMKFPGLIKEMFKYDMLNFSLHHTLVCKSDSRYGWNLKL